MSTPSGLASRYRRDLLPTLLLLTTAVCMLLGAGAARNQLIATARDQAVQSAILAARMSDLVTQLKTQVQLLSAALATDGTGAKIESNMRRLLASELGITVISSVSESGQNTIRLDQLLLAPRVSRGTIQLAPPIGLQILSNLEKDAAKIGFTFRAPRNYSNWLVGTLSATRISESMLTYGAQNDADVYLVNASRQLIAHPNTLRVARKESVARNRSVWQSMLLGGTEATQITTDANGKVLLTATSFVSGTPWELVVERPAIRAVVGLSDVFLLTITAVSLAAIMAWIASRKLSELIAAPIVNLTKFADGIEAGDFSSSIELDRSDEIGRLGKTLGSMATTIKQNYRQLDSKIAVRTRALAEANAALEIASRHKSEFLAHMSHELRTPLNAVIGFSDLLKAEYFGPLNQKQSEYVRDINASGQHLLSLINDILDLAKVEAGRMELMLSDAHVAALVESCVALVSERVSRSQQTLLTDVAPDVSMWPLDERKVKQCLLNLLTNASKFTPAGGVIALRVWIEGGQLVAAVSDNGVGIATDDLPKLFSEFYQARAADGGSDAGALREGTGLGLALTKRFVELHGGMIAVSSAVGQGSTFTIRFPAAGAVVVAKPDTARSANVVAAK